MGLVFLILIIGEVLSLIIFGVIKNKFSSNQTSTTSKNTVLNVSVFKGAFERLVLFIGIFNGYPQILIAFGALKLGTRLHEDNKNEISNDYFLIGNLASILIAMCYAIISKNILAP